MGCCLEKTSSTQRSPADIWRGTQLICSGSVCPKANEGDGYEDESKRGSGPGWGSGKGKAYWGGGGGRDLFLGCRFVLQENSRDVTVRFLGFQDCLVSEAEIGFLLKGYRQNILGRSVGTSVDRASWLAGLEEHGFLQD